MLTLVTSKPDLYALEGVTPAYHGTHPDWDAPAGHTALVEPVFHEFSGAGDNELGYAFVCAGNLAPHFERLTICLTYSQANAKVYKGYVNELSAALKETYTEVKAMHIPYATCGVPMGGSVLAITGSYEPYSPRMTSDVVMPSQYFEGLLSHVPRNRPNFPLTVSARGIGAVRSDLNLLPNLSLWGGRNLMAEYQDGRTTKLQRLTREHVGKLFGMVPVSYSPELALCMPAGVISSFL